VNNVYTGIVFLSAQVSFYAYDDESKVHEISSKTTELPSPIAADYVVSLSDPTQHNDAWSAMAIRGNQTMSMTVSLPFNDAIRAHIDLYASGHGCEEFWYTNPPDSISKLYGMCGGGSAREIQLSIDGKVAGVQPPFPVVYTGGINPLLWRPQTGIYSFNIPPYFFDITPLLVNLNDGKDHEIKVEIIGNSENGEWNVDPVFVAYRDPNSKLGPNRMIRGTIDYYHFFRRGPALVVSNSTSALNPNAAENVTWTENYTSELVIEASVGGASTKISSTVDFSSTNSLLSDNVQVTSLGMQIQLLSSAYDRVDRFEYPFALNSTYRDFNNSFLIVADIDYGVKHVVKGYNRKYPGDNNTKQMVYMDRIKANATYSRSKDANRTVYIADGSSSQSYEVFVGDGTDEAWSNELLDENWGNAETMPLCFHQGITSDQGYVNYYREFRDQHPCMPESFCLSFDACSPKPVNATSAAAVKGNNGVDRLLLHRHPRNALIIQDQQKQISFLKDVTQHMETS
jgi:hypothetical protein